MKKVFDKIKANPLFKGIGVNDFEAMLGCVEGHVLTYEKGAVIQLAGNPVNTVGLVVCGAVQVMREDNDGKQNLMAELHEGELFGEVFACAGVSHSPVTVLAGEPAEVLHLNYRKVITACSSACSFHQRLIENMLTLVAKKNLLLSQKIDILSKRTTRERLLLFFDYHRQGARRFTVQFSREELAAYLCVERSAMSAELSEMQRDGLICYDHNNFEILG